MTFLHNSTGIEPESKPVRELIPDNTWVVLEIKDYEEKETKKGDNMLVLECDCVSPPDYDGSKVWHGVVFMPKEREGKKVKGAGMSVHFRKCLGLPYGGNDAVNGEHYLDKKFKALIGIQDYQDKEGNWKKKNTVWEVMPMEQTPASPKPAEVDDDSTPF